MNKFIVAVIVGLLIFAACDENTKNDDCEECYEKSALLKLLDEK